MKVITVIAGDGVGQEVIPATVAVLEAMNLDLVFQYGDAGFGTFERLGTALPNATLELCQASDAILFGATQSPMTKVAGYASPILSLRRQFKMYANLRPATMNAIDLVVVRENTECLYLGREHLSVDGQTAIAERVITAQASRQIMETACQLAETRRGRVTVVHKANVLKETCGLFRREALKVAEQYPHLTIDEMLVDACAMKLAMDATPFDVIVTTNLFGDILSDLVAGLTGGPGLAPSANLGQGVPLFEPVHGSAPDIAGKGIADPRATCLAAALMLDALTMHADAERLRESVRNTPFMGSTSDTTQALIGALTIN